jgi:hypothetical protein
MSEVALSMDEILSRTDEQKKASSDLHPTVKQAIQAEAESPAGPDEMPILFPELSEFEINGEKIAIRVFTFGELPLMMELIELVQNMSVGADGEPLAMHKKALNMMASKELRSILAKNTHKPVEFFDTLDINTGIKIMAQLVTVNVSFFTTRVLPALTM